MWCRATISAAFGLALLLGCGPQPGAPPACGRGDSCPEGMACNVRDDHCYPALDPGGADEPPPDGATHDAAIGGADEPVVDGTLHDAPDGATHDAAIDGADEPALDGTPDAPEETALDGPSDVAADVACDPSPEDCDGLDNDCDGATDEDLGSITCGLGVCERTVPYCTAGAPQTCTPGLPDPVDLPDPFFVDSDCDGIDGETQNAIFVSTVGVDVPGCGAVAGPCRTVQAGIDQAVAQGRRDIYLAGGTYFAAAFFLADGVNVSGGFGANFQRDPALATGTRVATLLGQEGVEVEPGQFVAATVVAVGLTQPTQVAELDLVGAHATGQLATGQGRSSHVVIVKDVPADLLTIERNTISAGDGAAGSDAESTPLAPGEPMAGGPGVDGGESGGVRQGGFDGVNGCVGGYARGGKGGDGGNTVCVGGCAGQGGHNGQGWPEGGAGGIGGAGGGGDGAPGGPGQPGTDGSGGFGAAGGGRLVGSFFFGHDGADGVAGASGRGGGGGGGGGAYSDITVIADYGASGGGGGAGGCAASGGGGGMGGGGSFGIYLINASPTLFENTFLRGGGGAGGRGGDGGQGQAGGGGGSGGAAFEEGGAGGDGADGGRGGHGGGGGGGAGGPAFSVYRSSSTSEPALFENTSSGGSPGVGGPGGAGLANVGETGASGVVGDLGTCATPTMCFSPDAGQNPSVEGAVVITEIMKDPETLMDTDGEWLELFNPSTVETYNLSGCVLSDLATDNHTISWDLLLAPQSYVTLARSGDPGFVADYVYSSFVLVNAADEVVLTCGAVEIDRVAYDEVAFPDVAGASLSLDPPSVDAIQNDIGANWCPGQDAYNGDLGTPGAPNPPCM